MSRDFRELLALTADLPAGPFDRLPAHRVTPRAGPQATAELVVYATPQGIVIAIELHPGTAGKRLPEKLLNFSQLSRIHAPIVAPEF